MSTDKTPAADSKTTAPQSPFGAWAMPAMPNLPSMPVIPGVEAMQQAARKQLEQLEAMMDEYTSQEQKAVEQARHFAGEMVRLQQAGWDYALSLQAENRKLWRAQLQQFTRPAAPQA